MKTRIRLYVGRNVRGRAPTPQEREHQDKVCTGLMLENFDGATITEGKGIWKGSKGPEVEDCLVLETLTDGPTACVKARIVASCIAEQLAQEAVVMTAERVDFELVGPHDATILGGGSHG